MVISDNEIDTMKFNYNLWIKLNDSVSRHLVSVMLPLNKVRWWIEKEEQIKSNLPNNYNCFKNQPDLSFYCSLCVYMSCETVPAHFTSTCVKT